MILETADQRTADWYAARIGKATASRFKDAIATKKQTEKQKKDNVPGDPMQAQLDYLTELVVERLTQQPVQRYATAAMQWGTEQEPAARAAYERVTGTSVEETGFVAHDTLLAGCSPDGLVDWDGLIEIKCPNSNTHVDYLLAKEVPTKYKPQMLTQMLVTGRTWCDFVSFDPRLPEHLQLFVVRYEPKPEELTKIEADLVAFLNEVNQMELSLCQKN